MMFNVDSDPDPSHYNADHVREQDKYLPIANVARIMKRVLPENAKIAKDAKDCIQECVSEFISFLTSEGKFIERNGKRWREIYVPKNTNNYSFHN